MNYDCLLVDDEEALSESTRKYFNLCGVNTAWVASRRSCVDFFLDNQADLILLDINLSDGSGFELCSSLRKKTNVPILFISARTSDDDVLLALNVGGDDYVQKPYSLAVLLAKVKAMLKRYKTAVTVPTTFISNRLKIDFASERVFINGNEIDLKTMEYKLLAYLARHKNRTVAKDELFRNVWGESITGDNTLNVHIRRLREKVEVDPDKPRQIKTIWGTGYMFRADEP